MTPKTGDAVLLPGSREPKLVAFVSAEGDWFRTFGGAAFFTAGAVVVPLGEPASGRAA